MRILVATPYLAPHGGGLERYASCMSRELARQGHEITELGHAEAPFDAREGAIRRVAVAPRWRLSNTPVAPALMGEARRLLRERRHDVVLVHTPVPGAAEMAAWVARRERVPYVVTYHAGRLEAPRGSPLALAAWAHRNGLERGFLRRASGRIAVSEYVAANVFGRHPSVVIPPGVDTLRFRPGAAETPGRILFVGPVDRAYAWKGLSTLFDAFAAIAPKHPEAHLRVVGKGDLEESYHERARDAGLAKRFSIAGRVPEEQLPLEYQQASVLVLPSTTPAESFGMVLAEANASGRPVIGSRVGGIPCFVEHERNGLLAAPGDAQDLAVQLDRLLADATLRQRLGRAGREKVMANHRWDQLAKQTAAVLEGAL